MTTQIDVLKPGEMGRRYRVEAQRRKMSSVAVVLLALTACERQPTAPDFPCLGVFHRVAVYDSDGFAGCFRPDSMPTLSCTEKGCWFDA